MVSPAVAGLALTLAALLSALVAAGIRVIRPWEVGIYIRLGRFVGILRPGLHWVPPFISTVHRIDLRTQVVDVPRQEVITRDNSPVVVDAVVYYRVVDPKKAFFEVEDYRMAVVALAQTTLRSVIGDMELDEILYNRAAINARLRSILDEATDKWGVRVESVEIREVEPSPTVKKAMEEQTAAERERRAAILRADGEKRAAILRAEGEKQAMILRAEGERASKVLTAEGDRMALILRALGEAQRLRIIAAGAAALHPNAVAVLGLETLSSLASTPSTKLVLPYEVTQLARAVARHLGEAAERPPGPEAAEHLQEVQETLEKLLGRLPSIEEVTREIQQLREEAKKVESLRKVLAEEEVRSIIAGREKEEAGAREGSGSGS